MGGGCVTGPTHPWRMDGLNGSIDRAPTAPVSQPWNRSMVMIQVPIMYDMMRDLSLGIARA